MNDKPAPLDVGFQKRSIPGLGMKSALTERASEPWPKGVHPKEAEVERRRAAFRLGQYGCAYPLEATEVSRYRLKLQFVFDLVFQALTK